MSFSWAIFTCIKRHTQVTNDTAKPFISIKSQQSHKTLSTELAPVWCRSRSDIPSRLVDYLQFSFFFLSFFLFKLMCMLYNHHQPQGKQESKASENFPPSTQSQQEKVNEGPLALPWRGSHCPPRKYQTAGRMTQWSEFWAREVGGLVFRPRYV